MCHFENEKSGRTVSKNLESDPFLNSTLQRFTCELYYRFGSFLAPLNLALITSRHYLSEWNIADTKIEEKQVKEMKLATSIKYTGLGAAIDAEVMIGSWLIIGVISVVEVMDDLNYSVGTLTSSGNK